MDKPQTTRYHSGGIGRADLLRVLAALEQGKKDVSLADEMAQTLAFFRKPPPAALQAQLPEPDTDTRKPTPAANTGAARLVAPPPLPAPRAPLRAPMLGIATVKPVATPDAPQTPLPPLSASQYLPRKIGVVAFWPLLPAPKLARRLQGLLAQQAASHKPNLPHVVRQLAQGQLPQRWQTLFWPYPPDHLTIIIDRSLHLRPFWDDQAQLVQVAVQWLGENNVTTLTVQGDPWQALACWSGGKKRSPPPLRPPPAGCAVLLLTDMLPTAASSATATPRWLQALRYLERNGAQVLVYPPGHAAAATATAVYRVTKASSPALERLLTLLSCARLIEPALVRAMRRLEPTLAADPALEAQLWSCHHALRISYDMCVWRPACALAYRQGFESLPIALQQAALHTLREVHAVRGRAIEVQELLLWASHVPAATSAPYKQDILAAAEWLRRLPVSDESNVGQAELIAFIQETVAFHGDDGCLTRQFSAAFGPLWGIAHQAAQRNRQNLPDPGALPSEMLPLWREAPPGTVPRRYQLQLHHGQLELHSFNGKQGDDYARSPMGMALALGPLTVTSPAGKREFSYPERDTVRLGQALPKLALQLQTAALALEVREILPPFPDAERGRDQYGLYADLAMPWGEAVLKQRFRYIEPGQFLMGSPADEPGRSENEGPQHQVTITHGFWLADTACSQEIWQAVMGNNPSRFNKKNGGGPEHPVDSVSWFNIQEFLKKLNDRLLGCYFGLPTEAEWEYACRAGTTTPFSFGETITREQVNYVGDAYGNGKEGKYHAQTVAVKLLPANAWGLYQMHGNVWEWCADMERNYDVKPVSDPGLVQAFTPADEEGAARVLRGGGWLDIALDVRSAFRFRAQPSGLYGSAGFRLALRFQN